MGLLIVLYVAFDVSPSGQTIAVRSSTNIAANKKPPGRYQPGAFTVRKVSMILDTFRVTASKMSHHPVIFLNAVAVPAREAGNCGGRGGKPTRKWFRKCPCVGRQIQLLSFTFLKGVYL